MLGSVFLHVLTHAFVELLSVLCQIHVNEVDDNDSSHITQSQLACQFVGSSEIHIEGIGFLTIGGFRTVAAVHVYYVHGFGVFDNQIGSALVGNGLSEGGFQLLGYSKIVEDGKLSFVQFHDVRPFRGDERHVVLDFVEYGFVIYIDVFVRRVEQVTQHTYRAAGFFMNQSRELVVLLYFSDHFFPMSKQDFQFQVELGHSFTFGYGAYNHTEIFRLDALQ